MKAYLTPELEVVAFDANDVIVTSNPIDNEPGVFSPAVTDYDMF